MRDESANPIWQDRAAAARYVASLSSDLASIARSHGLDTLGYLLDMAHMEAENAARSRSGGREN